VTDVECASHRMEQPSQAVDTLASQGVAVDDGGVFEGEA
jgi:hypothetical protein